MKKLITILGIILLLGGIQLSICAYGSEYLPSYENGKGFELSVDGHDLEFVYSSGAFGNLYDNGEFIDRDVLWRFFSNGTYVYYTKNSNVYKLDLNTHDKTSIFLEEDTPFIEGVYNDKYLYYGSSKYMDITQSLQDLIIYDLENNREVTYIEDVGQMVMAGEFIFTTPCTGDISAMDLQRFNLDGSAPQTIADDAFAMEKFNNQLYYSAVDMSDGYSNVKEQIRKYDPQTGKTTNLTDYYRGYVKDFYSDHAVFSTFEGNETVVYYEDEIKVFLNGERLTFEQPPIIKDERTLVPMRAIFEAMGANVNWDGDTRTVTSTKNDLIIRLSIDDYIMQKNGVEIYLDVSAQLIDGYTMVPIRAVAEAFGANVDWDGDAKTIYITPSEM